MTGNQPDDKERIDTIPPSARVLGTDVEGRHHLYKLRFPTEVWVVDADGDACLHYEQLGERSLVSWVMFVAERCGWDRRHHIEKRGFEDLFDPEPTPPTREEVLAQMYHVVCHDCTFERLTADLGDAATVRSHHAVAEDHNAEYAEVAQMRERYCDHVWLRDDATSAVYRKCQRRRDIPD